MQDFKNDVEHCLQTLRAGGVILYPTDTVWGLGCDATNGEAVAKIYTIKRREETKSMIVLLAEERQILQYVAGPDPRIFDYLKTVKKPTTVIYEGAIGLAPNLPGPDGSIAIRLCSEPFCRQLINRFKKPIVSTSANFSGSPPPENFRSIPASIVQAADYVVQYRQDDPATARPSAIVKWKSSGIEVIRK